MKKKVDVVVCLSVGVCFLEVNTNSILVPLFCHYSFIRFISMYMCLCVCFMFMCYDTVSLNVLGLSISFAILFVYNVQFNYIFCMYVMYLYNVGINVTIKIFVVFFFIQRFAYTIFFF